MTKTFEQFLSEDFAFPKLFKKTEDSPYQPTKVIDDTLKTKLFCDYKIPDSVNPKDLEVYLHKFSRILDKPKSKDEIETAVNDIYKKLLELNPSLKGIASTDFHEIWSVISGALSGYLPEDISFFVKDTKCRGFAGIDDAYKKRVQDALGIVMSLNHSYMGGYLPCPKSLETIEKIIDAGEGVHEAFSTKVIPFGKNKHNSLKQQYYLERSAFVGKKEDLRVEMMKAAEYMIPKMAEKFVKYAQKPKTGLSVELRKKLVANEDFQRAFILAFYREINEMSRGMELIAVKDSRITNAFIQYFCSKMMDKYARMPSETVEREIKEEGIYVDIKDAVGGFGDTCPGLEGWVFGFNEKRCFKGLSYEVVTYDSYGDEHTALDIKLNFDGSVREFRFLAQRVKDAVSTAGVWSDVDFKQNVREKNWHTHNRKKEPLAKIGDDVELRIRLRGYSNASVKHEDENEGDKYEQANDILKELAKEKIIIIDPVFVHSIRGAEMGRELGLA